MRQTKPPAQDTGKTSKKTNGSTNGHRPRTPLTPVEQVIAGLKRSLRRMEPGQALPTVRAIALKYEVSTTTAGRAISKLMDDGLVTSRPGWGVFKAGKPEP